MANRKFIQRQGSEFGEPFFSQALWSWFSESTKLTDPPIEDWWRFPIQPEVGLNMNNRPDLCVYSGFFDEYRAHNLEEALSKYQDELRRGLHSCPLFYRFHVAAEGSPFEACAGAFLSQEGGPWDHDCPYFHEGLPLGQKGKADTLFLLTSEDTFSGDWYEYECDEQGTVSYQEYDYAPYLVVGGENEEQAEARWIDLASYLRKTMEALKSKDENDLQEEAS